MVKLVVQSSLNPETYLLLLKHLNEQMSSSKCVSVLVELGSSPLNMRSKICVCQSGTQINEHGNIHVAQRRCKTQCVFRNLTDSPRPDGCIRILTDRLRLQVRKHYPDGGQGMQSISNPQQFISHESRHTIQNPALSVLSCTVRIPARCPHSAAPAHPAAQRRAPVNAFA